MTDQEIVQALRCCAKGLGHDDACENCKVGEVQNRREYIEFAAANVIERLTAEIAALREKVPQWISVEDRLPELLKHIRELAEADKDGRVVVLPCKLGVDMVNRILPEQPFPMENVRLSITYYSRGRMYNMSLRTFEGAIKTGKIVVAGTATEKAMEDKKDG